MFKALNLFKTELTGVLESSDTRLLIPHDKSLVICELLGEARCIPCVEEEPIQNTGIFTKLVIHHNGYYEIVRVVGCENNVPIIQRGDECTTPKKFPVATCVQFMWTTGAVQHAINTVIEGGSLTNCAQDDGLIDLLGLINDLNNV